MKFKLEIDCDNAAFDGVEREEVARILLEAGRKVRNLNPPNYVGEKIALYDFNGNKVGEARFVRK